LYGREGLAPLSYLIDPKGAFNFCSDRGRQHRNSDLDQTSYIEAVFDNANHNGKFNKKNTKQKPGAGEFLAVLREK